MLTAAAGARGRLRVRGQDTCPPGAPADHAAERKFCSINHDLRHRAMGGVVPASDLGGYGRAWGGWWSEPPYSMHFGPDGGGMVTFLVCPPDDLVLVVTIQWLGRLLRLGAGQRLADLGPGGQGHHWGTSLGPGVSSRLFGVHGARVQPGVSPLRGVSFRRVLRTQALRRGDSCARRPRCPAGCGPRRIPPSWGSRRSSRPSRFS